MVLTIGGSDSGGGAGIQADIKTFSALGLHGTSALTAITAQNTQGVQQIYALPPEQVRAQLESITDDFSIAWAKTGMLHSTEIVNTVADHIRSSGIPLVLDPVIEAEAGGRLLRPSAVSSLKDHLIPLAEVVTPNIFEAEALTGIAVRDMVNAARAAGKIISLGAKAVIVKGGHLNCTDLVADGDEIVLLPSERIEGQNHGIGCTFSAALTSFLALGYSLENAARRAKEFAKSALRGSLKVGKGVGPVNQSAALREKASRYRVLCDLERALDLLEKDPKLFDLLPRGGARPAMAIPGGRCLEDVAELKGGMAMMGEQICRLGGICFGGESDSAAVLLTAMKIDPRARAAIDLGPDALFSCRELGLRIMDRALLDKLAADKGGLKSDEELSDMGAHSALQPAAIFEEGAMGKAPRLYLLGASASSLLDLVARMAGDEGYSRLRDDSKI